MKSFLISGAAAIALSGMWSVAADTTTKPDTTTQPAAPTENWTGYEGGSRRLNASAVVVEPDHLQKVWQRSFAPLRSSGRTLHTARNLVCVQGQIAVVAGDLADAPTDRTGAMVTILSAATGQTRTCVRTPAVTVNWGLAGYPLALGGDGHDTGPGMLLLHWDVGSGILFVSPCGDGGKNAAILPLANSADYRPGKALEAVPAYGQLAEKHPGLQDAVGHTRAQAGKKPLGPFDWLSEGGPNQPAFLDCDPETPLLAKTTYAHLQSSPLGLVNKYTGQSAWAQSQGQTSAIPGWALAGDPLAPQRSTDTRGKVGLRVFAGWGSVLTDGGRLFLMGPGPENPQRLAKKNEATAGIKDSAHLSFVLRRLCLEYPDAGLVLHAYDIAWEDRQPNDGAEKPQSLDTAVLTPAWAYFFPSAVPAPASTDKAESYLEIDGFYRNKAWLVDGAGVWATWKPSKAGAVQLIHADDKAATTFDLGVGAGLMGQDIWPHLAMAQAGGRRILVYYCGTGQRRRYTPCTVSYKDYRDLDAYFGAAFWDAKLLPPEAAPQIAVFDMEAGKVLWTQELAAAPDPPANDHMGYLDKSILVVAGDIAYVGWVDLTGPEAALQLSAFKLTGPKAPPVPVHIGLGFKSADAPASFLNDLIAVNGSLLALVTQGANLTAKSSLAPGQSGFLWTAQHVIAIAPTSTSPTPPAP